MQFSGIEVDQRKALLSYDDLPKHIKAFTQEYENNLTDEEYNNPNYAYRIGLFRKLENNKNKADSLYEHVPFGSDTEDKINTVIKMKEIEKFRPSDIVKTIQTMGYKKFKLHHHTQLWQSKNAKNEGKGYGKEVCGQWYWYRNWLDIIIEHVKDNAKLYV